MRRRIRGKFSGGLLDAKTNALTSFISSCPYCRMVLVSPRAPVRERQGERNVPGDDRSETGSFRRLANKACVWKLSFRGAQELRNCDALQTGRRQSCVAPHRL